MKRAVFAAVAVFVVTGAQPALASNQGLFGGRPSQDGSINLRSSTTSQFEPIRGQSVAARPRPDFDPTPIDFGSFQFFPSINVGGYYNSNVYAAQTGGLDDLIWKVNPALSAASNWGRHAIAFTGFADINKYSKNDTEDFTGGAMQLDGRYDITEQTWLGGKAGYQRATEPRGSSSTPGGAAEPTQYNLYTAGAEAYRGLGSLKAKVNYDFGYFDYDAVELIGGGLADQSGRNRLGNGLRTTIEYEVSPNFIPFVRGGYSWRDYTRNSQRSSDGYNIDIGSRLDFGGITTAEFYVGYLTRDYYNFANGKVDDIDFGANVLWNVTELTSVEFEGQRTIEETTLGGISSPAGASSYIATGGSATVTHELRRDLILEANLGFTNNAYQLNPRNDDNYLAGAGARYFFNRNFYSDLTYDFTRRDSNVAGNNYDQHIALIRFGAQY